MTFRYYDGERCLDCDDVGCHAERMAIQQAAKESESFVNEFARSTLLGTLFRREQRRHDVCQVRQRLNNRSAL